MCTYSLLYKNKIFNYIFSISTFHLNSGIYHTYSKLFYVHSSCVPTPPWGNLQGTAAFIYPSANGKITCTNASVNTQGKIVSLEAIITLHLAFHAHIQSFPLGETPLCGSALETVTIQTHTPRSAPCCTGRAAHPLPLLPPSHFFPCTSTGLARANLPPNSHWEEPWAVSFWCCPMTAQSLVHDTTIFGEGGNLPSFWKDSSPGHYT